MVATEERKKIRTTDPITGRFTWAYPDETPPFTGGGLAGGIEPKDVQRQAVADLSAGELLDWDGNEVEEWPETYEEYVNKMPSKAGLKRFPKPVFYWEVRYPGCSLQPFPRMGAIASTSTGLWQANNAVQDRAIREHITISTAQAGHSTNPDDLKITDDEMAVMNGKALGDIQYCQNAGCYFVTCSMRAGKLHALSNGHRLDYKPRT